MRGKGWGGEVTRGEKEEGNKEGGCGEREHVTRAGGKREGNKEKGKKWQGRICRERAGYREGKRAEEIRRREITSKLTGVGGEMRREGKRDNERRQRG